MSATILLKRTKGTSPPTAAPVGTGVSFGELVYTYDITNVGAGKSYKKLYIGHPDGNTNAPIAIGGEYYTDMLPENPADFGKPTGSKAVILNPSGQINTWSVATDLLVGAAATVSGNLSVAGNLDVTGDLTYDEVNARNWNITGVGTIPTLNVTNITDTLNLQSKVGIISALAGVGATYNDFNSTSAQFEQINVSHASTTKNLTVTGIATIEDNVDFRTQLIRIGKEAGELETDGSDRQGFFIGNFSGQQAGLTTLTNRNIAIGHSAFQKGGQTKAESNLFVGHFAGQEAEGSHNIYLGDRVGQDLGSQSVIGYGETGNATTISFSDGSQLPTDPYDYKVYGSIEAAGITSITGGMWAIAIEDLNDLSIVNNAVNSNLTFNVGTASNGHLEKTKSGPFKVKGSNNFALLTDNNDAIYLDSSSAGYLGLAGQYGFLLVTSGITTNSGKEDHDQNIGIGREALWGAGISTNQSNNIAIGAFTLYKVNGDNNIAIGNSAGVENTGSNNVIIGQNQDVAMTTEDTQLIIGSNNTKWISGNSDGWVGIGTTTADALLSVNGDLTVSGVATIPQIDINDIGVEDIKITAGVATDLAVTYAKIQTGIITDQTGTAATITRADFVDVDVEDIKITVGLATDLAITNLVNSVGIITNAYIDVGVVTSYVGTYSTINVVDIETLDARDVKITAGIVTDIVGTAATITNLDFTNVDIEDVKITAGLATDFAITNLVNSVGIITNAYIDVGVVTSYVGTYSTISVVDIETLDAKQTSITGLAVTDIVGTAATITTFDTETADLNDVKITTGIITSLVGTYSTITDVNITNDLRVGGATSMTGDVIITGNLTINGTETTINTATLTVDDKTIEIGKVATPTDTTADGGGIVLKGATDHSLLWDNARDSWKVSEDFSPNADGVKDLGQPDLEWQDLYVDGTAHLDDADILDVKITAGLATDFAITNLVNQVGIITNAYIDVGVVTSLVGTYATITVFDTETLDAKNTNITGLAVTDIVGTAATITTLDVQEGDIVNAKITAGVVTSFVGTYATITTAYIQDLTADNLQFVGLAVTDVQVSMAATFTGVIDVNDADLLNAKITTGIITSLVGTYATITTFDTETLDAKNVNITGLAVTDIVGTAATITTIDVSAGDILDANITGLAVTNTVGTYTTITGLFDSDGHTELDNTNIAGVTTFNNDIDLKGSQAGITSGFWDASANTWKFNDGTQVQFGDSADMKLFHDGEHSYIQDTGTGDLKLQGNNVLIQNTGGTENYIRAYNDGAVELYHGMAGGGSDKKIETISTGATVFGELFVSGDVRVGGALTVIGQTTFTGGTLTLGDADTDSVVFNADIDSSFIPDDDDTYSIGTASKQWKDIHIDGVAYIDDLSVDSTVGAYATITTLKATSADLNDAKITTGLTTNFTVGQVRGDGSLTINSPVGLNSHTDIPDNVEVRVGDNTDFKLYHQDTDAFNNRGHVILQHGNGNATYGRLQIRSDYFSVQTAAGNSDFLTVDDKTIKLMYADTSASGIGDRLVIRASGSEMLGIVTFKDNGVYKGEVAIGSSITATAGVVTANAVDLIDADILDAKITAGLATDFAITNAKIQSGIVTTMAVTDMTVSSASTNTGITSTQNLFVVGVATVLSSLNVNGINITGAGGTVVAGFGTDLISQNLLVTGIGTIGQVTVGKGNSATKINTNSGELVLDSAVGQVTIQDNVHVVGYATFRNGLYYRSDQGGSTGIGYSGPNGMGYFEDDGRLVSTASTVGFLTTSNYVMTTNASGVPSWSNSIDGGFF